MQKLFILILISTLLSCGKSIDQEPKQLKKQDIDGDKLLESKGNDLVANLPELSFKIPYLETTERLVPQNTDSTKVLKKELLSQLAPNMNKSKVELIKQGYGPKFQFTLQSVDMLKDIRFFITANQSSSSISNVVLKVYFNPLYPKFITLDDAIFDDESQTSIDLSDLYGNTIDNRVLTIEVDNFYFKRNNQIYNFNSFISDLRLKSYSLSIFQDDQYKSYYISKTIDIETALKLLGKKVKLDDKKRIESIDNKNNNFPTSELKKHRLIDSFWILTNTNGQNLNVTPFAGDDIHLINFTKNDLINFGLRQSIETLSFNKTNIKKIHMSEKLYSIEIISMTGDVLIPKQAHRMKNKSYETGGSDHDQGAGRYKSLPNANKSCSYHIYGIAYDNTRVSKDNVHLFFKENIFRSFLITDKNKKNFTMKFTSLHTKKLTTGTKSGSCPSRIKNFKRSSKPYTNLLNVKLKVLKRFTY